MSAVIRDIQSTSVFQSQRILGQLLTMVSENHTSDLKTEAGKYLQLSSLSIVLPSNRNDKFEPESSKRQTVILLSSPVPKI